MTYSSFILSNLFFFYFFERLLTERVDTLCQLLLAIDRGLSCALAVDSPNKREELFFFPECRHTFSHKL